MAKPPLVFVCYSRKDAATLEELRRHLKPFEDRRVLDVWYDLKIAPGDTPDERIQGVIAAADIVLLLVSPDSLASTYIEQEELPPIVDAGATRTKWVVPFFIRPSMARDRRLTFTAREGKSVQLVYWQGLNQPGEALAEAGPERDRGFVAACTRLLDLAETVKKRGQRSASSNPAGRTSDGKDVPEVRLWLTTHGNTVHREFLGSHGWRSTSHTDAFPGLGPLPRIWDPEQLFRALFGSDAECVRLLTAVRGLSERATPVSSGGLRVRIHADDQRLLAQPWLRTSWKQNSLVDAGWTFELSSLPTGAPTDTTPLLRLELPCNLITVLLDVEQRLHCAPHIQHVCTIGSRRPSLSNSRARPPHAPVATNLAELRGLSHHRPDILYVCGSATASDGNLWFAGDATGSRVGLHAVLATWEHHPPKVVLLNLMDAAPGTSQAAVHRIADKFPLVVMQTSGLTQIHANPGPLHAAERFLEGLIHGDNPEPVRLARAHCLPSVHVWTHYGKFVRPRAEQAQKLSPRRDLDREDQRAQALLQCKNLCEDPAHRTALLLAHGEAGNHLDQLGVQLQHTLHNAVSLRRISWRMPRTADGRLDGQVLAQNFDATLNVPHGISRNEAMKLLHREWFKPRSIGLILVDTGVFGGRHEPALRASDIDTLVHFCSEELASSCPDACRLVLLAALEVERSKFATIATKAARVRDHDQTHLFRFRSLDPLEAVTRSDLKSYLDKPGSGCPPGEAGRFATAVFEASRGRFEDAVRMLDEAALDGWSTGALTRLEAGKASSDPSTAQLPDETF